MSGDQKIGKFSVRNINLVRSSVKDRFDIKSLTQEEAKDVTKIPKEKKGVKVEKVHWECDPYYFGNEVMLGEPIEFLKQFMNREVLEDLMKNSTFREYFDKLYKEHSSNHVGQIARIITDVNNSIGSTKILSNNISDKFKEVDTSIQECMKKIETALAKLVSSDKISSGNTEILTTLIKKNEDMENTIKELQTYIKKQDEVNSELKSDLLKWKNETYKIIKELPSGNVNIDEIKKDIELIKSNIGDEFKKMCEKMNTDAIKKEIETIKKEIENSNKENNHAFKRVNDRIDICNVNIGITS